MALVLLIALVFGPGVSGFFFEDAFGTIPWCLQVPFRDVLGLVGGAAEYRSVMTATTWVQARVFGRWAGGYLAVGLMAYGGVALLVYDCIIRVGAPRGAAWLAAGIFALMPLNHKQAYYLTRPMDLWWAAFGVWLLTHPAYPRRWWLGVLGGGALALGLWSYEINLSIGAAVFGVAVLMQPRDAPLRVREIVLRVAPAAFVTGAYAVTRFVLARNFSFYYDVTGGTDSVLTAGPVGAALRYVQAFSYAALSRVLLLRPAEYGVLAWVTAVGPVAACGVCLSGRPRMPWRVPIALAVWTLATLVPVVDFVTAVDPESRHLFWLSWPLVTWLALYSRPPDASASARRWWSVCFGVVFLASCAEAFQWRSIHRLGRDAVASFAALLPGDARPTRFYLRALPGEYLGERVFSPATSGMLLAAPLAQWPAYIINEQRDLPHDPPMRVGPDVPATDPWPVRNLRWSGRHWTQDPLPAWARPAPVGSRDVGRWEGLAGWPRQGWQPNAHLVPVGRDAGGVWYRTVSRFSLLTGPPLAATDVPLAWGVVTMTARASRTQTYADWLFVTASDPVWDERKVVRFRIRADGVSRTYAVPILAHPRSLLAGPVTRVALRPIGEPDAMVRIDALRLVPVRSDARTPP